MIVHASRSEYGTNLFDKSSNRPTSEPQPLCFYGGKEYPDGDTVHTTHLTIPQAKRTYAVVGSRPYWIWGFEMGYNDKGVVIGNEAEGSRMDPKKEDKLGIIARYEPAHPCFLHIFSRIRSARSPIRQPFPMLAYPLSLSSKKCIRQETRYFKP